jgi:hypothetical protein
MKTLASDAARHVRRLYLSHIIVIDVGLGLVIAAAIAVITWYLDLSCKIDAFLEHDGTAVYGALLSTLGSLLGFAIAAITVVSAIILDRRFAEFRQGRHYDAFWAAFTWTIRALGMAAFAALVALFANQIKPFRVYLVIGCGFFLVMASSSLIRSGFTLEVLLRLTRAIGPNRPEPKPNPPVVP